MKKKLIEVALPLEAINDAAVHEKSVPRRGHPATLHLWWARRPLAAARAVLFASLVDDPSSKPDAFTTEEAQDAERARLFALLEVLCRWESTGDETILKKARAEIRAATGGDLPTIVDPFAGGGAIPVEAARLGLPVRASDLNPVPVLLNRVMLTFPRDFANTPPVHPDAARRLRGTEWLGTSGLAEDVRAYGRQLRDAAHQEIGGLYPKAAHHGSKVTVGSWIWARTVTCSNPGCRASIPLVRSFQLSSKKNRRTWVRPCVNTESRTVTFDIARGNGDIPPGTVARNAARCLVCEQTTPLSVVRTEAQTGRLGVVLLAIVGEGRRERLYLPATDEQSQAAARATPAWAPDDVVTTPSHDVDRLPMYGMRTWGEAFTPRQPTALTTLCDELPRVHAQVIADGGDERRATAIVTALSFAFDKLADWCSSVCTWIHQIEGVRHTFARHAISMAWDFVETNPFSNSAGNFMNHVEWVGAAVEALPRDVAAAEAVQLDARKAIPHEGPVVVCTDPPYYDNVGYADLSDFFYVWMRRSLRAYHPDLFSTLLTPKTDELVAMAHRHDGSKQSAREHFESGLKAAFERMRAVSDPKYPLTVFYAFKQTESEAKGDGNKLTASTGWETFLEGLLSAGFAITATWPIRTERAARTIGIGTNALASSIVLACRPRAVTAPLTSRREFITALKAELPPALAAMQHGNVAPVDLAQASIGPGMSVFSRFSKVVEADGSAMTVRAALALINQTLDELLEQQEGEFDAETRWAVAWFSQFGMSRGDFGVAETLSKAKNTAANALVDAGILESRAGKVRLLARHELDGAWDPATDSRLTVWEVCQHLIRLHEEEGEQAAAGLLRRVGGLAEGARELAYRLFAVAERKGWAQDALSYNALVVAWPELVRLAGAEPELVTQQRMELG